MSLQCDEVIDYTELCGGILNVAGSKFQVKRLIGEGATSGVFALDNECLVAKICFVNDYVDDRVYESSILQEIAAVEKSSEWATQLKSSAFTQVINNGLWIPVFAMVLEYVLPINTTNGKLNRQAWSLQMNRRALSLKRAVSNVHKLGIIHNDLKLDNLGLTNGGDICILDFGHGFRLKDEIGDVIGTQQYAAPEVFGYCIGDHERLEGFAIDLWSMDCVIIEMFSGVMAFKLAGCCSTHFCNSKCSRQFHAPHFITQVVRLCSPKSLIDFKRIWRCKFRVEPDRHIWNLIFCCLLRDPKKRVASIYRK